MSKKKATPGGRAKKKSGVSLVRSSAAEYPFKTRCTTPWTVKPRLN